MIAQENKLKPCPWMHPRGRRKKSEVWLWRHRLGHAFFGCLKMLFLNLFRSLMFPVLSMVLVNTLLCEVLDGLLHLSKIVLEWRGFILRNSKVKWMNCFKGFINCSKGFISWFSASTRLKYRCFTVIVKVGIWVGIEKVLSRLWYCSLDYISVNSSVGFPNGINF